MKYFKYIALSSLVPLFVNINTVFAENVCPKIEEIKNTKFIKADFNRRHGIWHAYTSSFISHGNKWVVRLGFPSDSPREEIVAEAQSKLPFLDLYPGGGPLYEDGVFICRYFTGEEGTTLATLS